MAKLDKDGFIKAWEDDRKALINDIVTYILYENISNNYKAEKTYNKIREILLEDSCYTNEYYSADDFVEFIILSILSIATPIGDKEYELYVTGD